jgi:hypothetical protein
MKALQRSEMLLKTIFLPMTALRDDPFSWMLTVSGL